MISKALTALALLAAAGENEDVPLYRTDFSRLAPGTFGAFAAKGFPEYHHVPRAFTDGWSVVNNRGPEEWKVLEIDGKNTLNFLGYNSEHWTKDYIYPLLCAGDALWTDYSVEVRLTPLSRPEVLDLQGVVFRYQDGRHYSFFGLAPGGKLVLRRRDGEKGFRKDGWKELASCDRALEPGRVCALRVEASGKDVACFVDGEKVLSAADDRGAGGKIGLLACSPVRFHEVAVRAPATAAAAAEERRRKQDEEVRALRATQPAPALWKKIPTPGFGVSRALRLGDLDGDGALDFLLAQSIPFFGSNYHMVSCLTALDSSGRVLWQRGRPNPDHAWVTYDVAVQIHDWDGDGAAEVIVAEDETLLVLEGKTGRPKRRHPVPESRILPEETSWKEYKHYYRRDHLPRINVDCLGFADLRGTGRPADLLIKDRHTRLWAFNDRFEPLWTASANLGHFPTFPDLDRDGKDEVLLGYTLFDHDGKVLWSLDRQMEEHSDGTCAGDFGLEGRDPLVFMAGSDDGVIVASIDGKIRRRHRVGHAQTPSVGQYRPDLPGLEFCTINFWGEPGLITLYGGGTGEEVARFELIHQGSPILPVNWRGDGQEFILLSTNPSEGGLVDGFGRRVVMFPEDGHPDLACMAHDLTGDPRDEIITWSPEAIWIYTQGEPFKGEKIYAPRRPPLYNESNYGPVVSWPAWKAAPGR
jgi:hypothetical protein